MIMDICARRKDKKEKTKEKTKDRLGEQSFVK